MSLEQGEDGDPELYDSLFRSPNEPERRRILFRLLGHDPREALAVPEEVRDGETARENSYIELAHRHLPMLEDVGLIHWDRKADRLHEGPRFTEVRDLLEAISEHDPLVVEL